MKRISFVLAIAALAVAPFAQGFAADAAKPAVAAPAAAPAAAKTADAAKPTGPAWSVRCEKDPKTKKDEGPKRGRCEIFQRLVVQKTGQRMVEFAIGFPKDKKVARGIIIAPLGILLQAGLIMKIDDGAPFKFQPRFCDNGGCYSYVDLDDKILDMMKKGTKIIVTFAAMDGKTMSVEMSLKDFAPALQSVS